MNTTNSIKANKQTERKPSLLTLILLISFASTATVLNTPAMPEMSRFFNLGSGVVQWFVTLFVLAYAIAPLLYGPITHRFGRKKTIYAGISIGIFGAIICVLAALVSSWPLMLFGRFIQGLGSGVGLVLALTIINDVYNGIEARRISSYTTLSFALLPALGIFIGGLFIHYFSWFSGFYIWIAYSILMLILAVHLPETSTVRDPQALNYKNICNRYFDAFTDKRVLTYALLWGSTTSIVYLFSADAPIIAINQFGISPFLFGIINTSMYLSLLLGNILSGKFSHCLSARQMIFIGIIAALVPSIALFFCYFLGYLNIWWFYGLGFFIFLGSPFMFSNSAVLAASHLENRVTASAVASFLNMGLAVLVLAITSLFPFGTDAVFTSTIVILMLVAGIIMMLSRQLG